MNREQALKLAEQALNGLAESLQQGRSENLTRFLEVMARFHRYSFRNVMLIAFQRPDATRVAGFHAWKQLGRSVMKGERGIGIVAPLACRRRHENDGSHSTDEDEATERTLRGFRIVHVFDISQTIGADLPDLARPQGEPGRYLARLEQLIRNRGLTLEYDDLPGGALGASMPGRIMIQSGLSPADTFAILAHELAHELLHRSKAQKPDSKTVRETEAEAVAHVVCHAFGVDSTRSSADYIQLYRGDLAALNASLQAIQSAAAQILVEMSQAEAIDAPGEAVLAAA